MPILIGGGTRVIDFGFEILTQLKKHMYKTLVV